MQLFAIQLENGKLNALINDNSVFFNENLSRHVENE